MHNIVKKLKIPIHSQIFREINPHHDFSSRVIFTEFSSRNRESKLWLFPHCGELGKTILGLGLQKPIRVNKYLFKKRILRRL